MGHAEGFMGLVTEAKSKIKEISIDETYNKMQAKEEFFLVDTREDSEWARGYIQGAVHIGKGVIERDIEAKIPDKDAQIILYCGGGFRSALAAEMVQKMGYTNVFSMDGGIRGWRDKELPEFQGD